MKKLYGLMAFFSVLNALTAQPLADNKRDYIWLFGELNELYNAGDTTYGGAYIDFKTNPPLLYKQPRQMNFSVGSFSLCNDDGDKPIYTNGIEVHNWGDSLIMNGDSIAFHNDFWDSYYNRGIGGRSDLFLKRDSIAYLIHPVSRLAQAGVPGTGFAQLEYSVINVNYNNGQGRVLSKNIRAYNDSLTVMPACCKHANGKDWWIIQPIVGNKYRVMTLNENGLSNYADTLFSTSNLQNGQSFFSADGNKYIVLDAHTWLFQNNPNTKFIVYDFDRCTGELSNEKIVYPPDGLLLLGAEASPNSHYLYLTNFDYVLQYDITLTTAAEIAASVDTVAVYDGFKHLGIYETKFFFLQNAPDGKIYMSTWGGSNRYMHVIENPNEKGKACHVRQHELWLPSWSEMTIPNFPNYRLGAIDGSVCDTLGIDQQVYPLLRLKPYKVNFGAVEVGQTYTRAVKAYNLGTGTVMPTQFSTQTGDYSLSLPTAIAVGDSATLTLTYTPSAASITAIDTLRIESNSQIPTNLIFAWADANTATDEVDDSSSFMLVYPNPSTGYLNLIGNFETAEVYDLTGRLLLETQESHLNIESLAKGMYLVLFKEANRVIYAQKVLRQ